MASSSTNIIAGVPSNSSAGAATQQAPTPAVDHTAQMNSFRSYVSMLADPGAKDENKLKAAQALSEDLEAIISSPQYPVFLEHAMKIFLKFLSEGDPLFISEYNVQQLRKIVLEVIHRLPSNDHLKPYLRPILSMVFKLLETDNEENVMVCLHIITELHKTYRPQYSPEIQKFLQFVKNMYRDLPNHVNTIFEPRAPRREKDLNTFNIEAALKETFTVTTISTESKTQEGQFVNYNLIPRATRSLKVLTELPIIFVLMIQLYKEQVYKDVQEFIPLIMETIILQPQQAHRDHPNFNKEVFVDLIGAQIKILSFLAYIIKTFQDKVAAHSLKLVTGMLNLLRLCPDEVASLRKELLIATKHILALELRVKFVPHIDKLFDENLLFGRGWTARENLRPLAYSTLADLIHHVRAELDMKALSRAVHLFSKNIHDETLPTSIQTMSCKLLLNLVDCIRAQSAKNQTDLLAGQDLLIRMLHVFVNKFKSIAKVQLPYLRNKQQAQAMNGSTLLSESLKMEDKSNSTICATESEKIDSTRLGLTHSSTATQTLSIQDCRALVKTLVSGVKTITWGCGNVTKNALEQQQNHQGQTQGGAYAKPFSPKETLVFIRFVKWAMQALEIYALTVPGQQPVVQRGQIPQTVRSKEEKEVLEHFASVFMMMSAFTFKEIFSTMIDYVVERIHLNPALQVVANSFLARQETSPIFATILVEYLLGHMEEMGTQMDKASLYLKLFKLVFGSVSILASENEQMLKPYLHKIVNRSMELAMTARDPYNYFLLLRALFRSIGGGNHDILYQEFLPLLPTLLQGLNSLQSGLHKQHMKDLFVELCLTVPVRLSSLLPYLPMLMDPLVSALNGSQTLISQGLRTLELCVDNLQPDFLYEHIQPVRAELMQALWKTLRNPSEQVAQGTFRVLGKFGGGNRKMMTEPQLMEYCEYENYTTCITIYFNEHKVPISLPVEKVIDVAFTALKSSATDPWYRQQCWEVIRCYLVGSIQQDENRQTVSKLISHPSFREAEIPKLHGQYYKCPDKQARKVHQTAVTAMFVAAAIKELRKSVLQTMVAVVRHYSLLAIVQQAGPFCLSGRWNKVQGMDPLVMIDALAVIMGHEEKELCKPGHLTFVLILNAATDVLGSKNRACQLPLMEYLVEKMCNLCYERAWYSKSGGCIAIKLLFEQMSLKWVLEHQYMFLRALLYIMMDLTEEVSTGAIESAKTNIERLIKLCASPLTGDNDTEEMKQVQDKSLGDVTQELVRQVTSSNSIVREQAMHLLQVIATLTGKIVKDVMEPHKDVLVDMCPPKKHFVLRHQPANIQIGLMDGNTFCTSLEPRLFTVDLETPEHKNFFNDLLQLADKDDAFLTKLACYKNVQDVVPLRIAALKALTACHYIEIQDAPKLILTSLMKSLNNSSHPELQQVAFECLVKYQKACPIAREGIHPFVRPLLGQLCNVKSVTLKIIKRLSYLTQLFPNTFNDKLCDQLVSHVKSFMESAIAFRKQENNVARYNNEDLALCAEIINIFHQIPAAHFKFVEHLHKLVMQAEKALMIEAASPLKQPMMSFMIKYPTKSVNLLLSNNYADEPYNGRYLEFLVIHEKGDIFRENLKNSRERLLEMITITPSETKSALQIQYVSIRMIWLLARKDSTWLDDSIIECLTQLWNSDEFQNRFQSGETVDYILWKVPRMIVCILLAQFKRDIENIALLFQILKAFLSRYIPDFHFLKEFLEDTVAGTYDCAWKRKLFFKFVETFEDLSVSQDLKAKILQQLIIPCFTVSLDNGECDALIGYPPAPDDDQSDSVVSVFINKIIKPDEPFKYTDSVRILLLQLSCLLVEKASSHIHDAANKRQGVKLRRLMTFAWPCLLTKNCVDPATKYHGHLLLSHIIAKFAIHKRIVLQVFHSLLKAHAMEARVVVRQALEILTPSMPVRMEDGNTMLTHWTRKILIEEGHTVGQLIHILQLIVRHSNVYYPVRHHLTQHITQAMHRLGFTPTANLEQRRLAVDLAEVCIKWEEQRVMDEPVEDLPTIGDTLKRSCSTDSQNEAKKPRLSSSACGVRASIDSSKPMDKTHADAVVYFLLRLACQVNELQPVAGGTPPGEALSKRCVILLKRALKPDIWPNSDPKLLWFDKFLQNLEGPSPNMTNICVGLELITFLIITLRKEQVLVAIKNLTKGLIVCMNHSNPKIIKLTHHLLLKLMTTFPTDQSNPVSTKHEELEDLYQKIAKTVYEGLTSFDKNQQASPSTLYGTIMILKAACSNNITYIDRLITPFMKVLQRMAREHLNPSSSESNSPMLCELLVMSLDMVKNRVGVMSVEMRKAFIGQILVGLIDKTPEAKIMKAICKIVEEWVRNKSPMAINQGPSVREKSILLVKLMQYVEKRFADDADLMSNFLELVNFVYRDETFKQTDLTSKLEPAFLCGLRSSQPAIRTKFFQVFHESMATKLQERLLYIVVSQNWEQMGPHYWIKQCIELLLITAKEGVPIQNCWKDNLLPSLLSVIGFADAADKSNFLSFTSLSDVTNEDTVMESNSEREDEIDMEISSVSQNAEQQLEPQDKIKNLLAAQNKFFNTAKDLTSSQFTIALSQLCHMDTLLAEWTWLQLFPRVWKLLTERQQQGLASEIAVFICSGAHVLQKDCHPSALCTFIEALSHCEPTIEIRPAIMQYLGKGHNLWYRMTLKLEQAALDYGALTIPPRNPRRDLIEFEGEPINNPQQEIVDCLSELYAILKEDDLWSGLWQTVANYPETKLAVTYEQHGFLEQAQAAFELSMSKSRNDCATRPSPVRMQSEMLMMEAHWLRCAKELNQWESILEYGKHKTSLNPLLVLESSWHIPNWTVMKDAIAHVEHTYPKEMAWKMNLYRGYVTICSPDDQNLNLVEKLVEVASGLCIREWKRLPHIVSHIHLTYLQAAQQVMELQEASQIHQGLMQGRSNSLHDMKAIVKTWRNRLPVIADDLSHWSDIFTWRQHHYQFIVNHYSESNENQGQSMLGVHASAQAIIHFGKIARKHNLSGVCLDSLSRIHTINSVPIVDCFQKIRQQVKCYHQMAMSNGLSKTDLQEGLEVIESTNLKFFTKEMTAEFYALKGTFLSQLGRTDEANKALSASVQLHDQLVKGWSMWGDYLEGLFTREPIQMETGVAAITCFLHASRHQNESKSRKHLAKVFWLLSFENDCGVLAEAVDKYSVGVPAIQWLAWIPQLLTCLVRPEGKVILNLLNQVGKLFPQAVYLPIRTLYLTLRIEQRGRYRRDSTAGTQTSGGANPAGTEQPGGPIRATEPMWRCSRILQIQRDCHPTVLVSLEGIAEQMGWFRENWYEEVLRQLRQALAKCYAKAFENCGSVADAVITPHTQSFIEKLVATFGVSYETGPGTGADKAKRQLPGNPPLPIFQKLKGQFTTEFDFSQPSTKKLHTLIHKLKKWIKIMELKMKLISKHFLLEEKCKFMSNFSTQTAEVEIPGEFLLPKQSNYYIKIARFLPRVDIVQKHGTAPRRLRIRGHNGRIYPFLIVSDSSLSDGCREERVLQLLRLLNHYFSKQKETSRRLVNMSIMRVVAVSPQMRLVEDNVSSISLLDIYKKRCAKKQLEPDTPINKFYEKLAAIQARGSQASHQVLRDIVKDVQTALVPKTILKDWALTTFPNPTNYWTFRKMLTIQLALIGLMKYALHLTRLYPDMLYVHQDSGLLNVAYFKFNIDDTKGELDGNWPVPFRLTPNLVELVSGIGVTGPFTAGIVSTARCLATPNFKISSFLRAIIRDEIIAWHKRSEGGGGGDSQLQPSGKIESEALIIRVNKAVNTIMNRLTSLATLDGTESKVTQLVRAVNCIDNLCRMDPAWHPWL